MKNLCECSEYRPGSQIARFCQENFLESILPVGETNIYNETNIALTSGLYENMK